MISKPVVIITGVSRGIGLATAQLFTASGWMVVGTVRDKKYPIELSMSSVDVQMAEMSEPKDLERVVKKTFRTYGRIDAVVANAGYGLLGAHETLTHDQIMEQLVVNTVAVSDLVREVTPIMRSSGKGVIIGVSSVAGRIGIPGYSAYNASKFAVEGLFEALSYELRDAGILVKLVEPSTVKTDFWGPSAHFSKKVKDYWTQRALKHAKGLNHGLSSTNVAKVIFRAATDGKVKLHYPIGLTWWGVLAKRVLPDRVFRAVVRRFL
jgi:short-subunit dehydrogenase